MKALILVLLFAGACFAGLSVNSASASRNFYQPGDPGIATVSVTNPSGSDRASSITMTVNSPPEILITSAPSLADISAGGSAVVTIPFQVKPDAKPGIYLINVFFSGFVNQGTSGNSVQTTNTASIPVTVVEEPQLSFAIDKPSLSGIDNVSITITNNGGRANNIKISVLSPGVSKISSAGAAQAGASGAASQGALAAMSPTSSPVAFYGTSQIFVQSLDKDGNAVVNVTLDSRNAPDGPIDVPLFVQYDDELGVPNAQNDPNSLTATLRVTVRNEKLDLGIVQQSDVVTKKENNLTLQLTNNGPDTISDVRLSLLDPSLRLKDQNELKFGDIAPGQSSTVTAVVYTDLPPGVNNINSSVSWIEKDVQKEESRTVPVTITSDADVGVYLEAKPLPLTVGGQHTLSVLVSNLGSYRIDNVDVSVSSPAMTSLDISGTQYIGGLNNDDFSTVQFLEQVNATQPGEYPIQLVVNYRDQSGALRQKVIDQTINVYAQPAQESSPLPIVAGIVVILAAVWWFKFRKPAK